MRIDPIYLVAREPEAKPTRRGFVFGTSCLLTGAALGLGGALLVRSTGPAVVPPPATTPATDNRLAWLHLLCADQTPLGDLLRYRTALLQELPRHADDSALWHGFSRLLGATLDRAAIADLALDANERQALAAELLDFLDHGPAAPTFVADDVREQLRRIARGR